MSGRRREEVILSTFREGPGRALEFLVRIDPAAAVADEGIMFIESHDYVSRPGAAGAEFSYYVKSPYASLLVAHFEESTFLMVPRGP